MGNHVIIAVVVKTVQSTLFIKHLYWMRLAGALDSFALRNSDRGVWRRWCRVIPCNISCVNQMIWVYLSLSPVCRRATHSTRQLGLAEAVDLRFLQHDLLTPVYANSKGGHCWLAPRNKQVELSLYVLYSFKDALHEVWLYRDVSFTVLILQQVCEDVCVLYDLLPLLLTIFHFFSVPLNWQKSMDSEPNSILQFIKTDSLI